MKIKNMARVHMENVQHDAVVPTKMHQIFGYLTRHGVQIEEAKNADFFAEVTKIGCTFKGTGYTIEVIA